MATKVGELTVPITFEMTDTGKQVLRGVVIEILGEVLGDTLHELVREDVRKMLQEPETAGVLADAVAARMVRDVRIHTGTWQRLEQKGI